MRHLHSLRMGAVRLMMATSAGTRKSGKGGVRSRTLQLPLLDDFPASPLIRLATASGRDATFEAVPTRSVLNSPAATHMPFWSINPYIGCEFGCTYCYARDTHRWAMERQGLQDTEKLLSFPASPLPRPDPFENRILVKIDAPTILRRTLDPARIDGAPIVIGTATDPYQPAERRFGITCSLLEALLKFRGLHLGIITKSPLITRDIPLLRKVAARHRLKIHISLATCDGALLRRLEPRTPMPHARLRALAQLTAADLDAGVLVAPIVPLLTDSREGLGRLFAAARAANATRVNGGVLRLGPTARRRFLAQIATEFPELLSRYQRHFSHSSNAEPAYRAALSRRLTKLQLEFGFPTGGQTSDVDAMNEVDGQHDEQMTYI